ncbi:MAG: sugar ABC transporter substrate-binding protein [Tepidanaerobacteraceae bacterium]|nr:sugar ABC transporter substrate-binding protein [Tepidanaerobacteraceae bacterium]
MLKKSLVILVVMTLMVGVIGCGGNNDNADVNKDSNKVIKLRMVETLTSPERSKLIRELLDQFEDKNPDIKVELISPPLENADQKLMQMLMNKEQVDIFEVRDQILKQCINNKHIENLEAYVENWNEYETLTQMAKDNAKIVGGSTYFIPYGFYQKTLFYRTDWFKEKGLKAPTTWEELYQVGTELNDPANNRYGYSFRGAAGGVWYLDMLIEQYIGDEVNIDCSYFTKDGKTIFEHPKALEAVEFYKKLYSDISPKDSLNWGYPEMVENFYSGTTAMLIQDPEVIATCEQHMQEGTWATAQLPLGPSGLAYPQIGYCGWGMTSYSEHKEAAWKLITFLSNSENNTYFAKKNSLIPIHTTADQDEYFKTGPFKSYLDMAKQPDKFIVVTPPYDYKGWGPFQKIATPDIQNMLLGKLEPEELLQKWADFWNDENNK